MIDVKVEAAGKWASILTLLGIDARYFNGKHQGCPVCNTGKDKFRWNKRTEYGHCNSCGSLSGMDIAIAHTGQPFKAVAEVIKTEFLGQAIMTQTPEYIDNDRDKNQQRLERIHKTLIYPSKGHAVLNYLAGRGLSTAPEKDLFEAPSLAYFNSDGEKVGTFSAMVAAFRDVSGRLCSYHVTYIDKGQKAYVEAPKKILPAIRSLKGAAIQLFAPANGVLGVAEGIETALAAHELDGCPMWATGNAQLMTAFEWPDSVTMLHIYCDQDASFTGQSAAYALAKRAALKGLTVRVHFPSLDGRYLTDKGDQYDFLDLLILKNYQSKMRQAA